MSDMPIQLAVMLAGWGFGVILVPPIFQLMRFPYMEYAITNQRLIIQTWALKRKTWSANFRDIKEVVVKKGIADKWLETGTIYPITSSYPFSPGMRFNYTEGAPFRVHRLLNPATGEYEEFSEMQIWRKTSFCPRLQSLKEPFEAQKLLQEAIENAREPNSQKSSELDFDQHRPQMQVPPENLSKEGYSKKQKIALAIGASLLFMGGLLFVVDYFTYIPYVSYDSGHTYVDYPLFGFILGFLGILIFFAVLSPRFERWASEHGAILVRG